LKGQSLAAERREQDGARGKFALVAPQACGTVDSAQLPQFNALV
jgi:hypothetical protein